MFAFSTFDKIGAVNSGDKPCVSAYDGFGYYMYLPHFFQKGHLKMEKEWAQDLQNEYCWGSQVYQLDKQDLKHEIDIYHMGLSFVMMPSYTVAEVWARAGGYETNGFTYPYHIMYLLNALLFIFLGLLYLRKLLLLFADERSTIATMVLITIGTNAYFIFNEQYDLPHLYLFTINAAALYHLIRYTREDKLKFLIFSAMLFGLAVCIRPTQLVFGIVPFVLLIQKHGRTSLFVKRILLFGASVLLCNIPQFLYWKMVGGEWLILNLHTEDIVLSDPNLIDFLFSYRKGWLLYSPLFLILPIGLWLLYKADKTLFWATSIFVAIYIYVMSSWECWWYADSFGQRVMVDIYPVLAIPILFIVKAIRNKFAIVLAGLFALGCTVLNHFQIEQMHRGIMDTQRMTREHYWHIFGKLDPGKIHHHYLLIDRSNPYWPEELAKHDNLSIILKERVVYRHPKIVTSEPGKHASITKIHLYDRFETDETRVEVPYMYTTSDSTQSALLRLECVSDYNCYSWNNVEVSLGKPQNKRIYDTLRFNLPDIRHNSDSMQIYIWNEGGAQIDLLQFKIIGTSLIRN